MGLLVQVERDHVVEVGVVGTVIAVVAAVAVVALITIAARRRVFGDCRAEFERQMVGFAGDEWPLPLVKGDLRPSQYAFL